MAKKPSKGELIAAKQNLGAIHDLATETGNWNAGSVHYHADSASRAMAIIHAGGEPLPEWAVRERRFLHGQGWRFPWGSVPDGLRMV